MSRLRDPVYAWRALRFGCDALLAAAGDHRRAAVVTELAPRLEHLRADGHITLEMPSLIAVARV